MTSKMRVAKLFILFIVCFNFCASQVDDAFIRHLTLHNLVKEHGLYLNRLPQDSDSSHYYQTKYHLKYFNDSLLLEHYFQSKALCTSDTALLVSASRAFLMQGKAIPTQAWFKALPLQATGKDLMGLRDIYSCAQNPNLFELKNFPLELQNSYKKYKKLYNKKPFCAAALSTFIPGLGKLYAGKNRSFLMTFILNAAYAAQTIESSKKLGQSHPFTLINAGAFTAFYLSNIYGSYKAIYKLKKEYKKQFLIDATQYYN